jgi:lysophospholipase L1-like esterase/alpha/beta superfamily hydrolase
MPARFVLFVISLLAVLTAVAQESVTFPTQDGGSVEAHHYGSGERGLVLVHGGRFNKESWEKQARILTNAGFNVLAIDLRGYGKSKGPGDSDLYTAPLHLDVLAGVSYLQKHGAKKVSLLGGSMGGGAAAEACALLKPEDLDAVILLAAIPEHPEQMRGRKLFILARDDVGPGDVPRLTKLNEQLPNVPDPKKLVVLDGSAHAQFIFASPQGERLMSEILAFLRPTTSLKSMSEHKRVVFLGDSITYAGEYIEFVETYLRLQYPNSPVELINLGLPSETVSGLSEPGHAGGKFPRPDLHERLDRVLEKAHPDLIFACYGMNDGIYYPFSHERFGRFQDGVGRLREKAEAAGAKIIHIAPPTFDPLPLKGKTLAAGLPDYRSPYEGYNEVLDRYSAWLVEQRMSGWEVIDVHSAMNSFLEAQRRSNPKFILAGDGVHANSQGHWIIARTILAYLGAPKDLVSSDSASALTQLTPNAGEVLKLVQQEQRILKDAWLTDVGHLRPGMAKGQPLSEAEAAAHTLGENLRKVAVSR